MMMMGRMDYAPAPRQYDDHDDGGGGGDYAPAARADLSDSYARWITHV